jgi:hypothetical protein
MPPSCASKQPEASSRLFALFPGLGAALLPLQGTVCLAVKPAAAIDPVIANRKRSLRPRREGGSLGSRKPDCPRPDRVFSRKS